MSATLETRPETRPETRIAMVLFPRLTQLDPTGPYEVLARMPGAGLGA